MKDAVASEAPARERIARLPWLGLGISTELGARHGGLDLFELRAAHPRFASFLEIGCDLERGIDEDARRWVEAGLPTTYHFLDLNLEESDDLDDAWVRDTTALARELGAAWICGDAGLWHVGPRERGHGVLAPPVLEESSARELARNVARLRRASGLEVLPENPPAHVYLGRMHLCDYLALVADAGDAALLLDVAHLAVFQRVRGHAPFERFDALPFERIVELHVAGGRPFTHEGRSFVEDDHGVDVLPETWELVEAVLARAPNVKAIVYECERNPIRAVVPGFERLAELLERSRAVRADSRTVLPLGDARARAAHADAQAAPDASVLRALQRTVFRMQVDPAFARSLLARDAAALATTGLAPADAAPLLDLDPRALSADPGGRRRAQILGNVLSEFRATHGWCVLGRGDARFPEGFLGSGELHEAMRAGGRLPLAFGAWAERRARETGDAELGALARLEHALARRRRAEIGESAALPRGSVRLAARAFLLVVPRGTHALASALRASTAGGEAHALPALEREGSETLLVCTAPRTSPHRLAEVAVERLEPPTDALLQYLREPRDAAALARFARRRGAHARDLVPLIEGLRAEGALIASEDLDLGA